MTRCWQSFSRKQKQNTLQPMPLPSVAPSLTGWPRFPCSARCVRSRKMRSTRAHSKLDTVGSILVIRYLLTAGDEALRNAWAPYRELKDGAQFASYIKANIEDRLAKAFAGKKAALQERLQTIGAVMYRSEARPDVAAALYPFPRLPLLIIFWDKDEEFDASFQFLFDKSAASYLDMEALAVALEYTCQKLIGGPGIAP